MSLHCNTYNTYNIYIYNIMVGALYPYLYPYPYTGNALTTRVLPLRCLEKRCSVCFTCYG